MYVSTFHKKKKKTRIFNLTLPNLSWSHTSRIKRSCKASSTTKSNVWFQTGFKLSGTTLVFDFDSDFFNVITTNGSAFPIKSTAGKSSADTTVTDSTPLTITSFFFELCGFFTSVISSESSLSGLSTFSKTVNEKFGLNGFLNPLSLPKGQYRSSNCTYITTKYIFNTIKRDVIKKENVKRFDPIIRTWRHSI